MLGIAEPVEATVFHQFNSPRKGDGSGAGAIARFRSACARNERRAPPRPLPGPTDRGATPTTGSARGAAPASLHAWLQPGAPLGAKGIARGAWAIDIAPSRLNRDASAINLDYARAQKGGVQFYGMPP